MGMPNKSVPTRASRFDQTPTHLGLDLNRAGVEYPGGVSVGCELKRFSDAVNMSGWDTLKHENARWLVGSQSTQPSSSLANQPTVFGADLL